MAETAEAALEAGRTSFSSGQYAEAAEHLFRAAALAESVDDRTTLVRALSLGARSYLIRGLKEEGRPHIERAAGLATPDDPPAWSAYLGVKGRFEWQDDDLGTAKATFTQWYDFCMAHEMTNPAIDAVHMIAIVVPTAEQIEWHRKGITLAEKAGEEGWLGPMWNNLGWAHFELEQYDEALDALTKARTYHYQHSGDIAKLAADIFVGKVLRVMGRVADAKREIDQAFERAQELIAPERDANACERLGNCYEELGEIDVVEGRQEEGLEKLRQAKELLIEAGAKEWGPEEVARLEERIAALSA